MNIIKLSMLSVTTASLLLMSGCNSSSSSNESELSGDGDTSVQINGLAIDGYISGATVCANMNLNATCDTGEPSATTDDKGRFELNAPGIDGVPLVLSGGIDVGTGLPFEGTLRAPAGSSTVTPLTAAIQDMVESSGTTPEEAEQVLKEQLGIPDDIKLTDFDPIAAVEAGGEGAEAARKVLATQTQLQILAQSIGNAVAGASDELDTGTAMADAMAEIARRIAAGEDISDPEVIREIVAQTAAIALAGDEEAQKKVVDVSEEVADKASEAANKAAESIEGAEGKDAIDNMNAAISASQQALGDALEEVVASGDVEVLIELVIDDLVEEAKGELPENSSSSEESSSSEASSQSSEAATSSEAASSSQIAVTTSSQASNSSTSITAASSQASSSSLSGATSSQATQSSEAASSSVAVAVNAISLPFSWGGFYGDVTRFETYQTTVNIDGSLENSYNKVYPNTGAVEPKIESESSFMLVNGEWQDSSILVAVLSADTTELTIPQYGSVVKKDNISNLAGTIPCIDGLGQVAFSYGAETFTLMARKIGEYYSLEEEFAKNEFYSPSSLEQFIQDQSAGKNFNETEDEQEIEFGECNLPGGTGCFYGLGAGGNVVLSYGGGVLGTWEIKYINSSSNLGIFFNTGDKRVDSMFYAVHNGKIFRGSFATGATSWMEASGGEYQYNEQALQDVLNAALSGEADFRQSCSGDYSGGESTSSEQSSSEEGSTSSSASEGSSSSEAQRMVNVMGNTYYTMSISDNSSAHCFSRRTYAQEFEKNEMMQNGHLQTEIFQVQNRSSLYLPADIVEASYFIDEYHFEDAFGVHSNNQLYFNTIEAAKNYLLANSLEDCTDFFPIQDPIEVTLSMSAISNLNFPVDFDDTIISTDVYSGSGEEVNLDVDYDPSQIAITENWANPTFSGMHNITITSIPSVVVSDTWVTLQLQNANPFSITNQNVTIRSSFRIKVDGNLDNNLHISMTPHNLFKVASGDSFEYGYQTDYVDNLIGATATAWDGSSVGTYNSARLSIMGNIPNRVVQTTVDFQFSGNGAGCGSIHDITGGAYISIGEWCDMSSTQVVALLTSHAYRVETNAAAQSEVATPTSEVTTSLHIDFGSQVSSSSEASSSSAASQPFTLGVIEGKTFFNVSQGFNGSIYRSKVIFHLDGTRSYFTLDGDGNWLQGSEIDYSITANGELFMDKNLGGIFEDGLYFEYQGAFMYPGQIAPAFSTEMRTGTQHFASRRFYENEADAIAYFNLLTSPLPPSGGSSSSEASHPPL